MLQGKMDALKCSMCKHIELLAIRHCAVDTKALPFQITVIRYHLGAGLPWLEALLSCSNSAAPFEVAARLPPAAAEASNTGTADCEGDPAVLTATLGCCSDIPGDVWRIFNSRAFFSSCSSISFVSVILPIQLGLGKLCYSFNPKHCQDCCLPWLSCDHRPHTTLMPHTL